MHTLAGFCVWGLPMTTFDYADSNFLKRASLEGCQRMSLFGQIAAVGGAMTDGRRERRV